MLSGVVLSGGRSSRMGMEKGLIELKGTPLIGYVLAAIEGIVDEVIISVAKGKGERYKAVLGKGVTIVEDETEDIGPLEGLTRSFSIAEGEYVLSAPCDTPFLKAGLCELVVKAAKGADGAMPKIGWKHEPLHGVYRREACLEAFKRALLDRRLKLLDAMQGLDIVYVQEEDIRAVDPELASFHNLNSPEDVRFAERRLSRMRA